MHFSLHLISTVALAILSTGVVAVPKPEGVGAVDISGRSTCYSGRYYGPKGCTNCPKGYSCSGNGDPQACGAGTFQNTTGKNFCYSTEPGTYQPNSGQNSSIPCPKGRYQPYSQQTFCYGAPTGRFQNLTGQATVCGVCCGWYTDKVDSAQNPQLTGANIHKCPAKTPYSGSSSGDGASGCSAQPKGCVPMKTCVEAANGTCPDQTFSG
ncbi:hypothetical protein FB45DRAFT_1027058 [Roridomyces roridus]|uniref:Uncharacterized protein n=1 Tax=Roridomyces roridus TaxID=1738132 RepID=A0AAD7BX29_9AGAR|nr:hypothetical protein FB45DRAFT_1027058 [Roridomyces roridus]